MDLQWTCKRQNPSYGGNGDRGPSAHRPRRAHDPDRGSPVQQKNPRTWTAEALNTVELGMGNPGIFTEQILRI
jgi:hypothetical protein